ncbi:MAG: C4-type zinc ribbon domain-containing protein [Anaerolineales bacterium]|nr:C4-type zinc ribbon domain-containing protein [Anaerolineales bacterium]
MNQTLSLYRLQQTDSQTTRALTRLQAIQEILENDEALRVAREQAEAAEKNRLSAERSLRQAEAAVRGQQIKIEQTEASLYGGQIHNPKELQELQNEAAALKRYLATLEDRQLEAMLADEEAEAAHLAAQATLQGTQSGLNERNRSLSQEQASLQREIEKFDAERQAIANAIPAEYIETYNRLRQQRGGVAVAGISDSTCAACGSGLTPAQQQAARSAAQIAHCPSCGRILYGS